MKKIIEIKIKKCNKGYYKKMYYPAFYFNPGAKRRALRVFALASKNKNEAMKSAMIFMNNYNGRISLLQENKYINPDYADVYVCNLIHQFLFEMSIEKQWKETTCIDKQNLCKKVMFPFYKKMQLGEITKEKMHEYLRYCHKQKNRKVINGKIKETKLSSRRIEKYWQINRSFILWLEVNDYIYFDPTKYIQPPKSKKSMPSQYWTKEEFKRFLSVIPQDSQDYTLFKLAFLTGMRQGEILGLTWRDIDFESNNVIIDKQYVSKTKKVDYPKTEDSVRITKIPETVKRDLLKLKTDVLEYYGISESRLKKLPIFTNGKGEHYPSKTLSTHMKFYIKESGVKKICFHELRNSFITNSIDNHITPDVVASMVGHKNIETTMNIYKCTTEKHKEMACDILNKFSEDI